MLEKLPPPCPDPEAVSTLPEPKIPSCGSVASVFIPGNPSSQTRPSQSSSAALEPTPVPCNKKKPMGPSHPLRRWGDGWGREHWSRTTQKVYGSPYNLGRGWSYLAEGSLEPQTLKVAEGTHFIQVHASRHLQMRTPRPRKM